MAASARQAAGHGSQPRRTPRTAPAAAAPTKRPANAAPHAC